jgi:hypothetical protein
MYFFVFYLYVFLLDTRMKYKSVASLHDKRPAPAAAGTLISEAGQLELVEANLPDLGSTFMSMPPL